MAEIENLQIVGGAIYTVGNQDIIADDWEAGKAYIKDRSYAIKDHKLYQCAVSHTSVEPFDPTKWTEKTVAEALGTAGSANMIECTLAEYNAWKAGGQLINETVYVITDAPNLNATANDIGYDASASYDNGSVGKAIQDIGVASNTDITFTLKSGAKFTVTAFVGKKAGIVNILNLKLTPTEATAIGTEIEVGNFANIYTYGSGTYYTGVVVDDQTKLVGSYLMTLGNQKLYLKFTDSTTRAIALTLVVFSA